MRPPHVTPVLLAITLALTACGGSDDEPAVGVDAAPVPGDVTTPAEPEATDASVNEPAAPPAGDVDCSIVTADEMVNHGFATQLLAQAVGQPQIDGIADGLIADYTPEAYAATLEKLHTLLDGRPGEVFGDPKPDLDFYEQVNEVVGRMLAVDGPVPQELFDEYNALTNGGTDVISRQLTLSDALATHCPDLVEQMGG